MGDGAVGIEFFVALEMNFDFLKGVVCGCDAAPFEWGDGIGIGADG